MHPKVSGHEYLASLSSEQLPAVAENHPRADRVCLDVLAVLLTVWVTPSLCETEAEGCGKKRKGL